jgi:hypothetical protein
VRGMYSDADILELASIVRADSTHLLSARKLARRVAQQFIHSRYENRGEAQYITSTQIWADKVLLMRVETLKARKTEESERLWKRDEEAREQSERLWMREE